MSNTKKILNSRQVSDQRKTLVLEFGVSAQRAAQIALDDHPPASSQAAPGESVNPARFRVVVYAFESTIDVYFHDSDVVGTEHWERLSDGIGFPQFPGVTFWRRMIVAEAFRRLAGHGPRQVTEAPTRARVVDLGIE